MQHVRPPLLPPSLSDRAPPSRPKLVYSWEPFSSIAKAVVPLFHEHWREIALNPDIPLDPDFDRYLAYEGAGILHILTARVSDTGRLVGYIFCTIGPHLHYASSRWCVVDMFWLAPEHRVGWNGIRLFKHAERRMAQLGAVNMVIAEKLHFHNPRDVKVGALMEFLGYSPIETAYAKRIG